MTRFAHGTVSDAGLVRENNQDAALVDDQLFVVADGMGGHSGGEVASEIAVMALGSALPTSTSALIEAVKTANAAVYERAEDDPTLRGMGTTVCALALVEGMQGGEQLAVVNVGDSRCYLLDGPDLIQVTEDHSLVENLVRDGRLSPGEAAVHPQRNIIVRAVGIEPDVDVDSWEVDVRPGDRFLLCSDGLSNEVSASELARVLKSEADADSAARLLTSMAKQAGGRDNITAIVVDVLDDNGRLAREFEVPMGASSFGAVADGFGDSGDGEDEAEVEGAPSEVTGLVVLPPSTKVEVADAHGVAQGEVAAPTDADTESGGVPGETPPAAVSESARSADEPLPTLELPVQTPGGDRPSGFLGPVGPVGAAPPAPQERSSVPQQAPTTKGPVQPVFGRRSRFSPPKFTGHAVAGVLVLGALAAAAWFGVNWARTSSHFVGFDEEGEVVIFEGHPDGILWIEPTIVQRTGIRQENLRAWDVAIIQKDVNAGTLDEAREWVAGLEQLEAAPGDDTAATGGESVEPEGGQSSVSPRPVSSTPTTLVTTTADLGATATTTVP